MTSFLRFRTATFIFDLKAFEPELIHRIEVVPFVVHIVQIEVQGIVFTGRVGFPFGGRFVAGRRIFVWVPALQEKTGAGIRRWKRLMETDPVLMKFDQ